MNMAENVTLQYRMKKKKIVQHLVHALDRGQGRPFLEQLHLLAFTFLKRLSIFAENMEEMIELGIIDQIQPFLETSNPDLMEIVLRVMFNLSFDAGVRQMLLKSDLADRLVNILRVEKCCDVAVHVLYNISTDNCIMRENPAFHRAVNYITTMIIQRPTKELLALAINLSLEPENALIMASGDNIGSLLKRLQEKLDPLLSKLIRNISEVKTPEVTQSFVRWLPLLVGMIQKCALKTASQDFLVSALATVANISVPGYGYSELIKQHGLLECLLKNLVLGFAEDDVVLEVLKVLSTLLIDPRSAISMAHTRVTSKLFDILVNKRDDIEIVLQLVYLFYKLLVNESSRGAVVQNHHLCECVMDLVVDPNPQIQHFADLCLDIISESTEEWRQIVLEQRFARCNYDWIQFSDSGSNPFEDDEHMMLQHDSMRSQDSFNMMSGEYYDQFADYGDGWDPSQYSGFEQNIHHVNEYDLHDYGYPDH
jgi:hypothetical protein